MISKNFTKVILPALALLAACARVDSISAPVTPPQSASPVLFIPQTANLTGSTPGAVPAPAGLKACFAGETNALDVVSNNVGALVGSTNFSAGRFGQAFDFHSVADGVVIPAGASLNVGPGAGITMSAWIFARGTSFGGATGAGPIVEFEGGAHIWQHSQTGNDFGLFTNLAEDTTSSKYHILQIGNAVPWNVWQHVAVTYSKASGTITLYSNGVQIGTSAAGSFSPNTATTLRIGQRVVQFLGLPSYAFNGAIDEVQLYDRQLTGAEVAQLASASGTMCVPPPASYQVTQMPVGSGESGIPFTTQPTVAILDAAGNIVSNATTPVTVTVSGAGTLTGTTTVNAVGGVATFTNLAIAGAGSTTVTFTSGGLPVTGGPATSSPLATSQVARKLALNTQPGGAQSGSPFSPQPVVSVRDAANLPIAGQTPSITASIALGIGTLGGTSAVTAVNSVASFTNLSVGGGSGPVTLTFSATGLASVTSNPFTITGLPAAALAIVTQPAGAESGVPFTSQPVVEVRDASGFRVTTATGTVTATIFSGTGGTLAGTATAPIVSGVATFANLQLNGPGTFTLRFASGALTPATSANVVATQAVRQLVILTGPAVVYSGTALSPAYSVELRDAAGIKVANSTLLIRINILPASAVLNGVTQLRAVAGVATFPGVSITNALGPVTVGFTMVEPGPLYGSPAVVAGPVTVLANNTVPPYTWGGFYGDVKAPPTVNKLEAGHSRTIQFSLGGNQGMGIFAPGYPATQAASCSNFATSGVMTPIKVGSGGDDEDDDDDDNNGKWNGGSAGSSSATFSTDAQIKAALKYENGKYKLSWVTSKSWKNTCRVLIIKFADGSTKTANFKFED